MRILLENRRGGAWIIQPIKNAIGPSIEESNARGIIPRVRSNSLSHQYIKLAAPIASQHVISNVIILVSYCLRQFVH